ncbi:RipA family octameric membrane protein [Streptomyces aureoversilis]|uniref:Transposase n=1 Tax=Streptomyces aureoversilis TaxID=67277 RepID=A0ABV9ZZK0_9ACTN
MEMADAGITLSAAWWMQLRSYRDLNTAKFKVINKLEECLPVHICADEWEALKSDPIPGWRKRYAELGTSERIVRCCRPRGSRYRWGIGVRRPVLLLVFTCRGWWHPFAPRSHGS